MSPLDRRTFLALGLAGAAKLAHAVDDSAKPARSNVHQQILDLAAEQEAKRRARFAAVRTPEELAKLQAELRETFLQLIGGLPEPQAPPTVKVTGTIEADGYTIDKLVYESFPNYFVPALLYRPRKISGRVPGILSPCGHSVTGKAADSYQILHINLARRGNIVLTYDPVGQGERSQFWDAEKKKSRFNLTCGEHAVLGNPLYLLGTSLARYRIWDGIRGIDYLTSLAEVDAKRIGCVGNSGGGTLTAYIAALDPRVACAAICCYITTLPRRMANRIEADPDADPEQDIFNFVGAGIDHAGLLALRAPRPTLLGTARFDFFPIEGARESFDEGRKLFAAAGAGEKIERVEAAEKHGLSLPLRQGVYRWFDHWLAGKETAADEIPVKPRPAKDLLVGPTGQVNIDFKSRHLLPLALEQFPPQPKRTREALRELLHLDPESADAEVTAKIPISKIENTIVLCLNGNEGPEWNEEKDFLKSMANAGHETRIVEPRGVGKLRPALAIRGQDYADPLAGVEENIAYNAFLVGKTLLGMRVADVLRVVSQMLKESPTAEIILCGRRDAALVAVLAAALEPTISRVVAEGLLLDYRDLFTPDAPAINAASILPGMFQFGDMVDVLSLISPRKVLLAASRGKLPKDIAGVKLIETELTKNPRAILGWLDD